MIALAVILTYGLQFFVPLEIIWNSIKHKFSHRWEVFGETVMRILMVLLTGNGNSIQLYLLYNYILKVCAIY